MSWRQTYAQIKIRIQSLRANSARATGYDTAITQRTGEFSLTRRAGFTGERQDKRGYRICYRDGHRIDCPKRDGPPDVHSRAGQQEKVPGKPRQSGTGAARRTATGKPLASQNKPGNSGSPRQQQAKRPTPQVAAQARAKSALARVRIDPNLPAPHQEALRNVAKAIGKNKHLTTEQRVEYFESTQRVVKAMSPKALARFNSGAAGGINFYSSMEELNKGVRAGFPNFKGQVAGVYAHTKQSGSLHVDGGRMGESAAQMRAAGRAVQSHELYAHEFAHSIDGPKLEISSSPEWQRAWREELQDGALTEYAGKKSSEGFAEFGRLVLSGEHNLAEIKRDYPKCFAVWQKHGLVAPTAQIAPPGKRVGVAEVYAVPIEIPSGGVIDTLRTGLGKIGRWLGGK